MKNVDTLQVTFFSQALASSSNGDWLGGPQALLQGVCRQRHQHQRFAGPPRVSFFFLCMLAH